MTAQAGGVHEAALAQLRSGRKTGHWMWFVFPQVAGLGRTETSRFYEVRSLAQARAYLAHSVLGPRLRACVDALLSLPDGATADGAMASDVDAAKLRSSLTLFLRAAPGDAQFAGVLDRFWAGIPDARTDALLAARR